ncbi:MAG: GNAT family N-acetyltransferase [Firmicutes bacterium]|nr:GNAT family N-acetyltransferase [Bacillota bacterium]
MQYQIYAMDEKAAFQIIHWHYDPPYNVYNLGGDEREIDAMLDGYHFAVYTEKEGLVGFFCYGLSAQLPGGRARGIYRGKRVLDIGLGMRPDLTGKGWGPSFVRAGVNFAIAKWRPLALRLTVASDNLRAIKVYERVGFTVIDSVTARTSRGLLDYYLMLLPLN